MTRLTYLTTLDRMLDAMQHDTLLDDRYGAAVAALIKHRAALDAPNGPSARVIDAVRDLERALEGLKGALR
jgi:hypothetical protein